MTNDDQLGECNQEEIVLNVLKELAELGYQIRLIINSLRGMGVPSSLIDAIVEGTTGYQKRRYEQSG